MPHARLCPTPLAIAFAMALGMLTSQAAQAQGASTAGTGATFEVSLPAQPLGTALNELARQAKLQLLVRPDLVAGKMAPAVAGRMTPQQALDRLLVGSGLAAGREGGAVVVKALPAETTSATTLPIVRVTAKAEPEVIGGRTEGYQAKRSGIGSKTDTPIIETPQSISVVTADFMEATGSQRLKDALAYTPGINVSPWGADSRFDWTIIRGFDAQTPGYYLDGLQLRNNNGWAIWQTENYGNERVDVLRGPTSVLYGQNGPGGMINVVSKRPTKDPLRSVQLQLGDNSRRQVAADFSGPLDDDGTLLFRVTGLVRDAKLQASGLPNDRVFLAPALTWRPSADTSLTVLSHFLRVRDGSSYGSFPEVGTLLHNPNGRFSPKTYVGEPGFDHFNQDQWMLGYLLEHRVDGRWTLRQNARYGFIDSDYRQVFNASSFEVVNADVADDPANFRRLSRFVFGSKEKAKLFTIDNQAQAQVNHGNVRHTFLVGLDYQHSRNDQRTYNNGVVSGIDGFSPIYSNDATEGTPWFDARTRLAQTGAYLQDQARWGDWVATVGGRYDRATASVDSNLDGSSTSFSDHKITKRAGLVYLHPSGWAPYLSYSESFSPTVTIDPETNKPLKPETGRQYEVGVRYQPVGGNAKYSAALFDLRRRNYITYTTDYLPKQTGEIQVRGLELEAAFQPVTRANVVAAYTYTPRAIVTASSTPSEIGKQMQAVSRNQLSGWVDYRFESSMQMGLGARFMGANHGYQEATSAPVPAYTVIDALLGYDLQQWSLALNLRNLTNKTYISNCISGSCYYGELRRVALTATYRW